MPDIFQIVNLPIIKKIRRVYDFPPGQISKFQKASVEKWDFAIPNTVVQTWEVNHFGRRHRKSLQSFRQLNQDINFKLYTKVDRDSFMQGLRNEKIRDLYFRCKFKPMEVDLFRYSYLFEKGGFYFDISMAVSKPLREFIQTDTTALITQEKNKSIFSPPIMAFKQIDDPLKLWGIWGFGFSPKHSILENVLRRIENYTEVFRGVPFEIPKDGIIALSGPAAFTSAVWDFLAGNSDESVTQLKNDFNAHGFRVPGAGYRHLDFPSYSEIRNESLFH